MAAPRICRKGSCQVPPIRGADGVGGFGVGGGARVECSVEAGASPGNLDAARSAQLRPAHGGGRGTRLRSIGERSRRRVRPRQLPTLRAERAARRDIADVGPANPHPRAIMVLETFHLYPKTPRDLTVSTRLGGGLSLVALCGWGCSSSPVPAVHVVAARDDARARRQRGGEAAHLVQPLAAAAAVPGRLGRRARRPRHRSTTTRASSSTSSTRPDASAPSSAAPSPSRRAARSSRAKTTCPARGNPPTKGGSSRRWRWSRTTGPPSIRAPSTTCLRRTLRRRSARTTW